MKLKTIAAIAILSFSSCKEREPPPVPIEGMIVAIPPNVNADSFIVKITDSLVKDYEKRLKKR